MCSPRPKQKRWSWFGIHFPAFLTGLADSVFIPFKQTVAAERPSSWRIVYHDILMAAGVSVIGYKKDKAGDGIFPPARAAVTVAE
jgi:hypothetical protein